MLYSNMVIYENLYWNTIKKLHITEKMDDALYDMKRTTQTVSQNTYFDHKYCTVDHFFMLDNNNDFKKRRWLWYAHTTVRSSYSSMVCPRTLVLKSILIKPDKNSFQPNTDGVSPAGHLYVDGTMVEP